MSSLIGPGQSAGEGEAPGGSEKFTFYTVQYQIEAKKLLCDAFF